MKNFIKTLTIAITVMFFTSCASILDSAKSVNTSALRIGMTKAEAQAALKKSLTVLWPPVTIPKLKPLLK